MQKLKDLNDSINLKKVRVKLSEALYNASSLPNYKIKTREVYIVGPMMGDFFVRVNPDSSQVYPMFNELLGWDQLKDLEVVEILK